MKPDWRQVVTNPAEVQIFEALEDPQWQWRSIGALSRVSGLPESEVRSVLYKYPSLVRKSSVPSADGQDLFTLQQRYYENKNPFDKGWDFLAPSSSSTSS
jgi:hypothetical protein